MITGREYQVYLFIDRTTATISSVHGDPGTNHNSHPYIESDRNHGTVSPIPADSPGMKTASSSARSTATRHARRDHPASHVTGRFLTAVCLQAPIYAIDAMDGTEGTPGSIHRANPNPGGDFKGQDLCIGKTWGISGFEADSVFNIGLNALHIWGISRSPKVRRS